jgi:hypothetical protein
VKLDMRRGKENDFSANSATSEGESPSRASLVPVRASSRLSRPAHGVVMSSARASSRSSNAEQGDIERALVVSRCEALSMRSGRASAGFGPRWRPAPIAFFESVLLSSASSSQKRPGVQTRTDETRRRGLRGELVRPEPRRRLPRETNRRRPRARDVRGIT